MRVDAVLFELDDVLVNTSVHAPQAELNRGVLDLFADLRKAGIRIALGSASGTARVILDRLGITDWFDAISVGDNHKRGKPHPDVFLAAAALLGTNPSHCLVVESTAAGIDAALRGGFVAVGLGRSESLGHAHLVIASLCEVNAESLNNLFKEYRRPALVGPAAPREIQVEHRVCPPLDASGSGPAWDGLPWQELQRVGGALNYRTRFKVLHHQDGLGFLVDCEDRVLHCTALKDQDPLFTEDVVEIFIQPDAGLPVYLEYELSPLNAEVLIQVVNTAGRFRGWGPWRLPESERVRHAVAVRGGDQKPGAAVAGWTAEMFFPWSLFKELSGGTPRPGDEWRVNVYRIDTDPQGTTHWSWDPRAATNFHDMNGFGRLKFKQRSS